MFDRLINTQTSVPGLQRMGRHLNTDVMIRTETTEWLVHIIAGKVAAVQTGPFVMPSYAFSMTANEQDWRDFLQDVPKPGCNDLIALLRRGVLQLAGDLHPLMSHLLYFKLLLASLRPNGVSL